MSPNVKRPTTLRSPWPPTDDLMKIQPVLGWDDWWTLQSLFKRCDPWDIIYYNFETYNSEEVNWYLRERIGCHDVSPDGKNYRFGPLPTGDPMQILRDPFASTLSFKVGTVELTPGDLLSVAAMIDAGRITVHHRPCLGWMSEYRSGPNQLLIPFANMPDIGMRALMVHEAVH